MSDSGHRFEGEPLEVENEEIARVVIKDRPEVAACLDGLVFRGREDAMIPLLRAALINMTANVLLDLEDEDALSACIGDLMLQTKRMPLAAKALDWEIQIRRDPQAAIQHRSAGYWAEVDELLHGPLPPLELVDPQERDAVVRRVNGSLRRETERGEANADARIKELQAILEDTGTGASSPWFLTSLSRPRIAEWLARWSDEAFGEKQASGRRTPPNLGGDLSLLRDIQKRLHRRGKGRTSVAAERCAPILPRSRA